MPNCITNKSIEDRGKKNKKQKRIKSTVNQTKGKKRKRGKYKIKIINIEK